MSNYNYLMKFILIGESGVGKSSFLYQFIENKFSEQIEPTIGIEFGSKLMILGDLTVRLQIWDSAGQENYRSITRSYYRNTICTMLMYDITSMRSFKEVKSWYEEACTHGSEQMYFLLVGNKCDMEQKRQVSFEEASNFAKQ